MLFVYLYESCVCFVICFFFFKQKTAYEMRISDWSSDVCSSDLLNPFVLDPEEDTIHLANIFAQDSIALREDITLTLGAKVEYSSYTGTEYLPSGRQIGRASCRERVSQYV